MDSNTYKIAMLALQSIKLIAHYFTIEFRDNEIWMSSSNIGE